jgi:two-component system sensor histidine kinase KdpD
LNRLKNQLPISWRDTLIFAVIFTAAIAVCILLNPNSSGDYHAPLIFVLAVMIVSLNTEGYFYGILAAVLAVIGVNYLFTYPYMALNFSITGYPLTFVTMLTVSLIISTLTTRLKEQERMRVEIEKEAVRANLLRAISHDLRTPLTSIVGSTSAILDSYDSLSPETKRELLGGVREDAQWLIRMVENILSITRIGTEPSQTQLIKKPEAVEEILGEVLDKFKKRYSGIAVSVKVPAELLMVWMDAMLIEQVILNIMENAVIHGVTTTEISVSVYRRDLEAIFEIRDNGKGISPDVYPKLFNESIPSTLRQETDNKRSMGIGLYVCTSIIKAHGGTLKAENVIDSGGTKFYFTLPMDE